MNEFCVHVWVTSLTYIHYVYANVQNRQTNKYHEILTISDLLDVLDKGQSVCIV